MNTQELIDEASSLPVEQRLELVDALLRTLNQPESEIDTAWAAVARTRLTELRSGVARPVPGDQVFRKVRERFEE